MSFKSTVKAWFETGDIPTQAQFYSKFDYLRWKDEKIPITDIEDIEEILDAKADDQRVTNLFATVRIIPVGEMLVFKVAPNENESEKEPGDYCMGIVEDSFVNGNWTGDNDQLKSSYV